ncbi:cyanobacterial porin [Crinalium epipsammum PCC 9333]|uniref:Cyanobacterial porin n=1 Tax=Crinalium epipsammum PCC 9333 TaxID=1173022 RepID=K9VYU4_9CYAN|nr:iron uptake porin [Crinalium epipsammum]AFZ12667.1 cyanobacterial porin [Crinalium epipsammum PCC 9333]
MSKILWKSLLISPAILSAALMVSRGAVAAETQAVKEINQNQTVAVNAEVATTKQTTVSTSAIALQEPTVASSNKTQQVALKISEPTSVATTEVPSKINLETSVAQAAPTNGTEASSTDTNLLNQIERYGKEGSAAPDAGQVTNVSQFRDVQPSDWAYEALSRVVQTYGCLQGYPDGTYRGNRALSRYEFAAGLNACLRQIEALIAGRPPGGSGVSPADLQALQRLTEEFRTELATIGTRVDNLEGRTAFLEQRQFSTTTKLAGEAILALTDTFDDYANETVFGNRVRLDLRTSFTGRDTLHTRLAAGNLEPFNFITRDPEGNAQSFEGQQTFNISPGGNNNIKLDWLGYYFPLGASKVYLTAQGGTHSDYAATNNPYFEDYDGGNGALSTFAQHNPIYRIGGGAGGAVTLGLGSGRGGLLRPTGLTVGYLASNGNDTNFNGFLKGDYAALGQLNFNVGDRAALALTYVRGYQQQTPVLFNMGGTAGQRGLERAFSPVVGTNAFNPGFDGNGQLISNSYGLSAALRPSNNLSISGFVGKTDARVNNFNDNSVTDGDIWYYGAGIALPNFGKEGNVLGIFAGVEPNLRGLSIDGVAQNLAPFNKTGYHIEGFYKYQLTDNISITPGVIYLTNPGQSDLNPDMVIGTLRTTMTF